MNRYDAFVERYMGRYRVMVQVCRESQPSPMLAKGGEPLMFPTRLDAEIARADTLLKFMNGHTIRGEIFEVTRNAAKETAEKLFMGGGKIIPVQRIAARSAPAKMEMAR